MTQEAVALELQRLREAAAASTAPAEPMAPVSTVRQEEGMPTKHWFRSRTRELLAGEHAGRWVWLEYTFPVGIQSLVLRWHEGQPPALWRVDREAARNMLNPGSQLLIPLSGQAFPAGELQQLETILQHAPHSLWARVVKLALELAQTR